MSASTAVALPTGNRSLTEKMAQRLGVDKELLVNAIQNTLFQNKLQRPLNQAEVVSVMLLCEEHKLNPMNREIYFESGIYGDLVPVLTLDGWVRVVNNHPEFDGMEFAESDEYVTVGMSKPCPKWIETKIYRKDRRVPVGVREHIDEVFMACGEGGFGLTWLTHTKRRLRHKSLVQCARLAFGFGGIYDPDEAMRIIDGEVIDVSFGDVVHLDQMPLTDELQGELDRTVAGLVKRFNIDPGVQQACVDLLNERYSGRSLAYALDAFSDAIGIDQDSSIDATDAAIDNSTSK